MMPMKSAQTFNVFMVNALSIPIKIKPLTGLFADAVKDGLVVTVRFRIYVPVRPSLYALVSQLTIDRFVFVLSVNSDLDA
jgi:hypothetical protein